MKRIEVTIGPSQMRATVRIAKPDPQAETPEVTVYDVLDELRAGGVVFGINREAIESLLAGQRWDEYVQVAKGVDPLRGEAGRVEYTFDTSPPKPQEMEDGKVNLRDIGLIHVVQEGQVLARLIPPKSGIEGTTVTGHEIPAQAGAEAVIKAGKNTCFADGNPHELLAQVTGSVSLVNGAINVERTFIVTGDVDFSTGNIDFPGDVLIYKDVKCGFRVKAGGKIEVRGVVEDALLEAGGDVLVKGGFEGTGRGLIRSNGNVQVKFIENQTIEAAGSVFIAISSLNARITSGDTIWLNKGVGVVRGGRLCAQGWIVIKVAGNTSYTPTLLEILQEGKINPELEKKELDVTLLQLELARTRLALSLLLRKKPVDREEKKELEAEKVKLCERLEAIRVDLEAAIVKLKEFKSGLPAARSTGCVQILQKAYPGVRVVIGSLKYVLNDDHHRALFKKCGLEVAVLSPEEAAHEEIAW